MFVQLSETGLDQHKKAQEIFYSRLDLDAMRIQN